MCCSVLQRVAACCTNDKFDWSTSPEIISECCCVFQCVAVCCSMLQRVALTTNSTGQHLQRSFQCVAVCCSVFPCAAMCCSVLQRVAACCTNNSLNFWAVSTLRWLPNLLRNNLVCDLHCVAVCCSVLQCVAVCYRCHFKTNKISNEAFVPVKTAQQLRFNFWFFVKQHLQHTATHCNTLQHTESLVWDFCNRVEYSGAIGGAMCCRVLQCVAVRCSVLQYVTVYCNLSFCNSIVEYSGVRVGAMCCSVL